MMGGNVFAGKTAPILRENIKPTLSAYFSELCELFPNKADIFNNIQFESLGSTGKKPQSGDIDLGVAPSTILDKDLSDNAVAQWNIDPSEVSITFNKLKRRAITSTDDQLRIKAFLIHLTKYINKNATSIHCNEKKVDVGGMFTLFPQKDAQLNDIDAGVQIDWMVGDLDWLRFSYYSAEYCTDSNVKGLHRTQLMLSAFRVAGLSFSHGVGVKDRISKMMLATEPDQALTILNQRLGVDITRSIAEDYYKLNTLLQYQLSTADYDRMIDIYFEILDHTRADIPDDLQAEWLDRRDRLQLTGKFLPEDSKLRAAL